MNNFVILLDKSNSHRRKDENGYLIVENNPIALCGVYDYLLSEIDENSKSDDIVKVYRPFDDLQTNKDKFKNKPIIWQHKWTGAEGENQKADGAIFGDIEAKDKGLYADLIIYNKDLIDAIEKGKCYELSPGYEAQVEAEQGEYNGEPYSFKQKLINVNHLAVVERGRTGHDLRIQDENQIQGAEKMTLKAFWDKFKRYADEEIAKDDTLAEEEVEETLDSETEIISDSEEEILLSDNEIIELDSDDEILLSDDEIIELDSDDEIVKLENECKTEDSLEKIVNRLVDERLNAYKMVDEAIAEVKSICGDFNTKAIKTTDEAYATGYKMLTNKALDKHLDSKTAFKMAADMLKNSVKTSDGVSVSEKSSIAKLADNFK